MSHSEPYQPEVAPVVFVEHEPRHHVAEVPLEGGRIGSIRTPARAVLVAVVLVLSGCALGDDASDTGADRGYPTAPPQHAPDLAGEHDGDIEGIPIADLADPGWIQDTSVRTGIPSRAVAAYAGAALRVAETRPECGLGWNTLAGVGAVESAHGSHRGASIDAEGRVAPEIIGVPLDGSEGVMEIPDTDDGVLDGDTRWDRAVGPMQFIPTTWDRYAQDGNLDGQADPHHIDDAVLAAAVYLCERGGDLTDDDGWNAAIMAYNQSLEYAWRVADHATMYVD